MAAGQNTAALAVTAVNLNGATITDGSGNAASFSLSGLTQTGPQIDTTTPMVSAIAESPSSGDVTTGNTVTLTLDLSENVTVNTSGGTPTLTLNDGETASYVGGSGTSALTFNYTVAAGDKTSALTATTVNLNGATIADSAGNAANLSLTGLTQTGPQINTTTPKISSITESPSGGDVTTGNSVALTLGMNEAVTVNTSGGTPTLTLNDGETATYVSGSGTNALTFNYTVGAADAIAALAATAVNLNGATIADGSGNAANLSVSGLTQTGPQINTPVGTWYNQSFPTQTTTFTASFDATPSQLGSDIVIGLSPTAASAYTGLAASIRFNSSNTIDVRDGSSYSADVSVPYTAGTTYQFSMVVDVATDTYSVYVTPQGGSQIALATNYSFRTEQATATSLSDLTEYTDAGTVSVSNFAISASPTSRPWSRAPSSGDLDAGKTVTYTLTMSEVVTVNTTGGSPTLSLNDGGTATYVSGSGTSALTFSYTVLAGQNTPDLMVTAVNLNGATIQDGSGNSANLSLTGITQGSPQIDTTRADGFVGDGDRGRLRRRQGADADAQYERGGERDRHADADAQRWRHRQLCQRLRLQRAGVQLHGCGRAEHRCAAGDRGHRHHHRPRRQCAEHHRPAGDIYRRHRRHHDADDQRDCGIAVERRPQCRQDRHLHPHHERSGDGQHHRRHADADAQRRQHRDL